MWNLEVDGEHEYVAEGVIVHNCVHGLTHLLKQGGGGGRTHSSGGMSLA